MSPVGHDLEVQNDRLVSESVDVEAVPEVETVRDDREVVIGRDVKVVIKSIAEDLAIATTKRRI